MSGQVVLQKGREHSVVRGHPWIFSGAIARRSGIAAEGEIVSVLSSDGRPVGCGYTSEEGSIAVKILEFGRGELPDDFWLRRFEEAFRMRRKVGLGIAPETTAYRVIHGEGDGIPGLICDRYNETYVLQFHAVGIARQRDAIVDALLESAPERPKGIYLKMHETRGGANSGGTVRSEYLFGEAGDPIIFENGMRFLVDWEGGQKTGFFLDQRENRALLRRYAHGARVLNTFCYTGGFSIAALHGGARSVVSVDTSAAALETLARNVELNGFPRTDPTGGEEFHEILREDVLQYAGREAREFDLIVLDPPAFVKHRGALRGGLQGYRKMNRFGFDRLAPGGILFTFSCSQAVTPELFRTEVLGAAYDVGRSARIIHQLHQAPCHPFLLAHPEGEYLKGLVLVVDGAQTGDGARAGDGAEGTGSRRRARSA